MNLAARVGRIERAVAPEGGCAVCRGHGPMDGAVVVVEDGREVPPPRPCAGCGRAFGGPRRVIILPPEEGDGDGA